MGDKASVLVVDDEESITSVISRMLEEEKFRCFTASSVMEAMSLFETNRIDLIITDILMPGMSGLEFIEKVRDISPDIPVAVLTAHGNYYVAVKALNHGAFYFVEKPFTKGTIMGVVERGMNLLKITSENFDVLPYAEQTLSYRVKSDFSMVPGIAHQVSRACEDMRFPHRTVHFAIPLAINELVINAIKHGNKSDPDKEVKVEAKLSSGKFALTVEDEGDGFNFSALPKGFSEESLLNETGRGLLMVRYYMDELKFEKDGSRVVCSLNNSSGTDGKR